MFSNPTPPDNQRSPLMNNLQSVSRQAYQQVQRQAGRFPYQVWAIILILVSGGIGFTATTMLFKLPKSPQCSRIFWPIASASMRLYCAQLSADDRTVDGLLRAIELVASLPQDHPLYAEANRSIEEWADEILSLADESYQNGKLDDAIATVKRIPNQVQAYKLVEERIAVWQKTWKKGEAIFAEVEDNLRQARWNEAFRAAVKLLNLDNRYWGTTKYDQSVKNIQLAQEESSKLDTAYNILRRGGIDNWIKAITEAQKIPKESYAYQESLGLIDKAKTKLQKFIENLIDGKDWQTLASTVERIPENIFPAEDMSEWQLLGTAGSDAQSGTLEGIQSAISTAEQIADQTRPLYLVAQELIQGWRTEETALAQLAKAQQIAASGTVEDLNAAIAEAQQVPETNPRYKDALQDINNWTEQIQIYEDKPVLTKAKELAISGDINDLEQAINQASSIGSDRALYSEARQEMREWQTMVERQEDQPLLDQAKSIAANQDYSAAISLASQIRSGRALYSEARKNINLWQQEIQSQKTLQRANSLAANRTPESLSNAIRLIRQIPLATEAGSQRVQSINTWSYQLLSLAQEKASQSDLSEAIRLARIIPKESAAYSTARDLIKDWQLSLTPVPTTVPVTPTTTDLENSTIPAEPAQTTITTP